MIFKKALVLAFLVMVAQVTNAQNEKVRVQLLGNKNVVLFLSKANVQASAAGVDAQNNIYATGTFSNDLIVGTNKLKSVGRKDIFLVGMDKDLNVSWAKNIGGSNDDYVNSMHTSDDGTTYLLMTYVEETTVGDVNMKAQGTKDVLVLKLHKAGKIDGYMSLNISGNPMGEDLAVARDGSMYMLLTYEDQLTIDNETYDAPDREEEGALVVKLNKEGKISWVKALKGIQKDSRLVLDIGPDDFLYVSGTFTRVLKLDKVKETANGSSDAFLAKIDAGGKVVWLERSKGKGAEVIRDLGIALDGSVYVTGYFAEEVVLGTKREGAVSDYDIFLAKYNTDGSVNWLRVGNGGFQDDKSSNLVVRTNGNIYITGNYTGDITFKDQTISGASGKEAFIASFGKDGMLKWLKQAGGSDIDRGIDVDITGNDEVIVLGEFSGTATFSGTTVKALGGTDAFLWKF